MNKGRGTIGIGVMILGAACISCNHSRPDVESGPCEPNHCEFDLFDARARLLHQAAMTMYVDYSSPPIPASMMRLYESKDKNPNLGMYVPFWDYPVPAGEFLRDAEGNRIVMEGKEDFVFGGKLMMAYLDSGPASPLLLDPFNPGQPLEGIKIGRFYGVKSVGPNGVTDLNSWYEADSIETVKSLSYDPTNGLISGGDIVFWGSGDRP